MLREIMNTIVNILASEDPFITEERDPSDGSTTSCPNDIRARFGNVLQLNDGTTFMVIAKPVRLHTALHSATLGLDGWFHAGTITEADLLAVNIDPDALKSNKDGIEVDGALYCRWDGKYVKWLRKSAMERVLDEVARTRDL